MRILRAHTSSSTGTNYGVYGETNSPDGYAGCFKGGRNYFEGKVGIGTDAPSYPMHVETDGTHDRAIYASHTGESGRAVYGEALGSQGKGVAGFSTATSGVNCGVYGSSAGDEGCGVYGLADHLSGATRGILGECRSDSGVGVAGYALSESGTTHGVEGSTLSPNGFGVFGKSFDPVGYRVYSLGRLRVEHPAIADSVSWPVGIKNSSHAPHGAGMCVSDDGFFDVTNDALNSSANFARLNNTGNWTVVGDRRLKRDIRPLSGALD